MPFQTAAAISALVAVTLLGTVYSLPTKPNIVFVLTDDLSWDLVNFMPNVRQMQAEGRTFTNFFVANSLCCPSRSTIFTGNYPHNTGVWTNSGYDGGYQVFRDLGNDNDSFSEILSKNGYATAIMGKYLNGYNVTMAPSPGWTTWAVSDTGGYWPYGYTIRLNNTRIKYGGAPEDYVTDVLNGLAIDFVQENKARPFMLEVATFAPHAPELPAPRDLYKFPNLTAPRPPSFNRVPINAPRWLAEIPPLNETLIGRIDVEYRNRTRMVQAVDKLIGDLRRKLVRLGLSNHTYFFFSSDNGFHMGQFRLVPGKQTPFTMDIKVPLIVTGPGIAAGSKSPQITQTTDLCPTFAQLAGKPIPPGTSARDGVSLVPLMLGQTPPNWRTVALIEQQTYSGTINDPDWVPIGFPANYALPPRFTALRGRDYLYIEWNKFDERQFHNLTKDPAEMYNTWKLQGVGRQNVLHAQLQALMTCRGASCTQLATLVLK